MSYDKEYREKNINLYLHKRGGNKYVSRAMSFSMYPGVGLSSVDVASESIFLSILEEERKGDRLYSMLEIYLNYGSRH